MKHTILKKSFREIENKEWEDEIPSQNDSYVFRKAYELYHKKLEDFTDEDLKSDVTLAEVLDNHETIIKKDDPSIDQMTIFEFIEDKHE